MTNEPLNLFIDGTAAYAPDVYEDLPRAVLISLFTWRRANADDDLPGTNKYGWWGDTYAEIDNDRIGSRLWLLNRAKLTTETVLRAKEYAEESLQWLLDDGVATTVEVEAERQGLFRLALGIKLTRGDLGLINMRFANVWDYLGGFSTVETPPMVVVDRSILLLDQADNFLVDQTGNNNLMSQVL